MSRCFAVPILLFAVGVSVVACSSPEPGALPPYVDPTDDGGSGGDGGSGARDGALIDEGGGQGDSGDGGNSVRPLHVSGTRLKARFIETTDGTTRFAGWRDSQRNEKCAFSNAPDGKVR